MELIIGDYVIEPIHIIGFVVIIALLFFVFWLMQRQKAGIVKATRLAIVEEAGPEVPYDKVDLEQLVVVIKPEDEESKKASISDKESLEDTPQFEQFQTVRFKVFSKPNTQVTFNIQINGNPIAKINPGFFDYTFEEAGEYIITAQVVEHPATVCELKIIITEFDYSKVQLILTKFDGTYQTQVGLNDDYYLEIYPNYSFKVNIYVDDKYYTQVQGTNKFLCTFYDAGQHTLYGVLDSEKNVYTDYLTINAVEATSYDQGQTSEEEASTE